ncbi:MAG TPA: hypothetical protein VMM56_17155, partial [Planctomycetaceae bacterium]|nr:hypothetical protein [Planctomycetaceae bacterium]
MRTIHCSLAMLSLTLVVRAILAADALSAADPEPSLAPLRYNNPGLVVDLGVGLWAWPMPMDYDGDGDFDLVVSCPDKPSNGTYFFENTSDGKEKLPVFKPGVKIGPGFHNVRVSYVEGNPVVLQEMKEYTDFRKTQYQQP